MDSFTLNKIAGSVLAALLLMVGLRTFIGMAWPTGDANLSKGTIVVTSSSPAAPAAGSAAEQSAAGEAPPAAEPPFNVELASANAEAGAKDVKPCELCHNFAKGAGTKVGPDLYGVVGRKIASEPGFDYSEAFQHKGGTWTFENLYTYLRNPKAFIPGNKMAFPGVPNPKQRADIIAFLNKNSASPEPLPAK